MEIKRFKIKDLIPAPYNPRTISDSALSGLRASIKRFGYVDPIIRNSNGHIIGGHQRIKALLAEGYDPDTEIEVVLVDIPEIEEKALNIALNNPAIQGDFDYLKLEPLLLELREGLGDLVLEELKLDSLIPIEKEKDASPQMNELEFRIIVDCDSEQQQGELLLKFEDEGIKCRALIS